LLDLGILLGRAELEVFGSRLGALEVAGRHVEGITGLQHLLLAIDRERHPSLLLRRIVGH